MVVLEFLASLLQGIGPENKKELSLLQENGDVPTCNLSLISEPCEYGGWRIISTKLNDWTLTK